MLNRTRFNGSLYLAMDLDSERADFGERDVLLFQRKACLGVTKRVKPIAPLKSRIAGGLAGLDAIKEPVKSPLETKQHILKHLTMDVVIFRPKLFDLWQITLLLIVADRFARHAIGVFAFGKRRIVQLSASVQCP